MIVNSQFKPSWSVGKGLMPLSSLKFAAPDILLDNIRSILLTRLLRRLCRKYHITG